jgi:hypothetical protein
MPGCNSLSEIMIGSCYKYYPVTHIRIMGIEENSRTCTITHFQTVYHAYKVK